MKRGPLPPLDGPGVRAKSVATINRHWVLAIDPGVVGEGCACAWAKDGSIWQVGYRTSPKAGDPRVDLVVVERPAYQGQRSDDARMQDVMALCWAGAKLAYGYAGQRCDVSEYTPQQWKGSEAKPPHHLRLWEALEPAERKLLGGAPTLARIEAAVEKGARVAWKGLGSGKAYGKWTGHNLLDAAGLCLVAIGRRF